jgi:predicted DNA-binding protein
MPATARGKGSNQTRREASGRSKNTVRVSEHTHATLRNLAAETGEPMQELIAEAVEAFRRRRILELTNTAYAAMRSDPEIWQEELEEREAWDTILRDGLEDE